MGKGAQVNPLSSDKPMANPVNYIGLAAWKFVPEEPRHNTFHNAIARAKLPDNSHVQYLGLKNTFYTDWVTQVLPDTVLKRFPYISPRSFRQVSEALKLDVEKPTIIFMFEGSFLWALLLKLLGRTLENSAVICNLFPASGHQNLLFEGSVIRPSYRLLLKYFYSQKNLILTFDTYLMQAKVNKALGENVIQGRFPLPSALNFRQASKGFSNGHSRVLVNMRNFDVEKLHKYLEASCKDCVFVFPRGPLASEPLWNKFHSYQNVVFDEASVPLDQYQDYIDQFDYMIFLYEPSIDSSGKLLDALVRNIPVCLPRQSTEWVEIAQADGRLFTYEWGSEIEVLKAFYHPNFSGNSLMHEPDFTPSKSLARMRLMAADGIARSRQNSTLFRVNTYFFISLHWLISLTASAIYSLSLKVGLK